MAWEEVPWRSVLHFADGLGVLPQKGSFRITFDPSSSTWAVYGTWSTEYVNPATVTSLLGTESDGFYAYSPMPYFGIGGQTSGAEYFDNLRVAVIPEPAASAGLAGVILSGTTSCAKRRSPRPGASA